MISFLMILSTLVNTSNFSFYENSNHAMYISVVEIEKAVDNNNGLIRVKVFTNDLEDAIFNFSQQRIDLSGGNCKPSTKLINDYFAAHLDIKIGDEFIKLSFSSCEENDISSWLNFDFTSQENWKTVEVKADYLMELFPTQSNIVNISNEGEKRMFRLTKDNPKKTILFSN